MKKIMINMLIIGTSALLYAGGDILPQVFEPEEVVAPVEPYVPPVAKVVTPPVAIVPPPVLKDIVPLGLYVGLGLTVARYDPKCGCPMKGQVDKTAGLIGRIGYDFNQFVGVEARGIRTKWRSEGGDIKHVGLFVKPMYPVSNDINVYGLAGYAKTTTAGVTRRRVDAETFAWGAGLEYDLETDVPKAGKYNRAFDGYGDQEGGWGLFMDYERLVQKSGSPDLDTINFGITYDF